MLVPLLVLSQNPQTGEANDKIIYEVSTCDLASNSKSFAVHQILMQTWVMMLLLPSIIDFTFLLI